MKPGYQTTEFWVTILTQIIAILVLTGKISASDAGMLKDSLAQIVEHGAALIASAAVVYKYIQSRTDVKMIEGGKGFVLPPSK